MNKNLIKNSAMTALMLMPLAYLAFIWPTVPQTIPTHIGVHGPDAWGDKTTLFIPTTVLALAGMIAYYLLLYIQKIDPKRAAKPISSATDHPHTHRSSWSGCMGRQNDTLYPHYRSGTCWNDSLLPFVVYTKD